MARRSKARSLSIAIRQSPVLAAAVETPSGGSGAVRIIWGDNNNIRVFPSTNADLASSTSGETTI